MKTSLSLRLAAGFAAVILLMTVTNIVAIDLVTRSRYTRMVRNADLERAEALVPWLADLYSREGSWASLREEFRLPTPPEERMDMAGHMGMMGRRAGARGMRLMTPLTRILVTEPDGTVVADTAGQITGRFRRADAVNMGVPVIVDGKTVGFVYARSMIESGLSVEDEGFLAAIRLVVILSAVAVSVVAGIIGLLLLRHLTSPLARLSKAAVHVAEGNLDIRVPEQGSLETSSLGAQFNLMVESLKKSSEAQKRFIADSAHELRTPVTLIQGTLELMLEGIYPIERERIESLHDETVRLGRLVSELRELASADERSFRLEREDIDAAAVVRNAARSFEAVSKRQSVGLVLVLPDSPVHLFADGGKLQRVLANLLSNAFRATPGGGTVTVSLETAGEAALFSVADTGPGIPAAERERVFERFYRMDGSRSRESGGSGLGLSISREIVAALGGRIWVDPDRTKGARLCFTIPFRPEDASESRP